MQQLLLLLNAIVIISTLIMVVLEFTKGYAFIHMLTCFSWVEDINLLLFKFICISMSNFKFDLLNSSVDIVKDHCWRLIFWAIGSD